MAWIKARLGIPVDCRPLSPHIAINPNGSGRNFWTNDVILHFNPQKEGDLTNGSKKVFVEQPWLQWLFIFTNTEFIVYINLDYNMKGTLGFFLASVSTAFDTVYCFILLLLLMKWPLFNSMPCQRHAASCTLHTAHCTLHTAHCTLHTAHCTLHSACCTDYRCQTTTVWCRPAADMEKDNCLTQTRFEPKLFYPKSV